MNEYELLRKITARYLALLNAPKRSLVAMVFTCGVYMPFISFADD